MEEEFIQKLREKLPFHPALELGIGDDAACVDLQASSHCLVTVDLLTDLVDFDLREADPRRIGRKAFAVNLSDIAAMAGTPLAAVVSFVVPKQGGKRLAEEIYEGLLPLAEEFNVALAGGDTNSWDGPLAISVTLIGIPHRKGNLRRDQAQPGDRILVTGAFGGSILGKHFDFQPRVSEAQFLRENYKLHAGIDVSDGLAKDLSRILDASEVGAVVDTSHIPISPAAYQLSEQDEKSPLQHALGDGEDFELILTVPAQVAEELIAAQPLDVPLTEIGHLTEKLGLWQETSHGVEPLEVVGWEHRFE